MATDNRLHAKEFTDDFPFDPYLRIPPLLDPIPVLVSRRPSPLEPNARVNDGSRNATAKLSSRTKALKEAKSVADDDPAAYTARRSLTDSRTSEVDTESETSRKRQKGDPGYLQLPKPTAKAKAQKPPPFKSVPVLNELHEPPPSAALFPPITPSVCHDPEPNSKTDLSISDPNVAHASAQRPALGLVGAADPVKGPRVRAKRICLRGRLKWTESETRDLMKGVSLYGVGKWKKILTHPDLKFHPDRTMVDLKDRYRTCRMNEEKAIERQANKDISKASSPRIASKVLGNGQLPDTNQNSSPRSGRQSDAGGELERPPSPSSQDSCFSVYTPHNFKDHKSLTKVKKRGGSHPWTVEEDADLSKGYQKYGFQWTAIAKDKDLCLSHRTGPQVRDRFRMKYPVVYQSSVPLPLPEVTKRPPRSRSQRLTSTVNESNQTISKGSAELKFIINETIKQPLIYSTKKDDTFHSQMQIAPNGLPIGEAKVNTAPSIIDRFSGLEVHPLPDPDSIDDEASDSETEDSGSDEGGRQSIAEEDARHLSILGLLNEDVEQSSRLPPFKYPFDDDWVTDESVTLPPLQPSLHWEEIASRPIFDLE